MQNRTARRAAIFFVVLAWLAPPAFAQLPPPPPPPATLWSFLGIPQAYRGFRDSLNARGNRPGLERKPPMKAIADPNNLKSDVPAIKKAAEVKMAEDLAPQKIKAVKYLAGIGCGCYNRDGSITDALLKAMDDCTEDVRLQTVWAISEAAAGEACANCKQRSCCSEELSNKLYEIAYERDDTGCYLEPSERVRLAAAEALRTCCPGGDEDFMIQPRPQTEGGGERPGLTPESGGERPGDVPPLPPTPAPSPEAATAPKSSRRTAMSADVPAKLAVVSTVPKATTAGESAPSVQRSIYVVPAAASSAPAKDASNSAVPVISGSNVPLPPIVKPDNMKRPPPAKKPDGKQSSNQTRQSELPTMEDPVPAPPVPPAPDDALLVAVRQSELPVANAPEKTSSQRASSQRAKRAEPAPARPPEQPPRTVSSKPATQRTLPGAQFGAGMVTAIHMKEGIAVLQFAGEAAIPSGSILRTYHEFALTGRTAVCDLEVVRGESGLAAAVVRPGSKLKDLAIGDEAIVLK